MRWWRVYEMHTLVFLLGSVPAFLLVAGAGGLGAGVLSLVAGTERLTRDIVQLLCHKITRKFSLTQLLLFLQILKMFELQCVWFLSRMFRCRTKNYKTVVKLFFKSFTMFELLPILGWHRLSRTFHNLHSLLTSFPLFRYWECSGVDDHWSPVYYWCWVRRMECCRWADHWYHSDLVSPPSWAGWDTELSWGCTGHRTDHCSSLRCLVLTHLLCTLHVSPQLICDNINNAWFTGFILILNINEVWVLNSRLWTVLPTKDISNHKIGHSICGSVCMCLAFFSVAGAD